MPLIIGLLGVGSFIIALTVSWQVKNINPDFISVAKYNLMIAPILFLANISLGIGFTKGHQIYKNLPLIIASQTFIYYLFILGFSMYLLGDKVSVIKALLAFSMIAFAIWLIKS
ncbi:MAG: hypothetical protein VR72_00420 [Clostridiaceae bacterium BRH_c20a]|nr:MAG: hypothetical protein VR72_00420 [Clostridiaceae bacterium BRH_c20a]